MVRLKIVFFGEADNGKSTIVGCLYVEQLGVDVDEFISKKKQELGSNYEPDLVFNYFVNTDLRESVTVAGTHNKKYRQYAPSIVKHLRNITIDDDGDPIELTLIDTPGSARFFREQEFGVSLADIGVFCIDINTVLDDNFDQYYFERTDFWSERNPYEKLIILLTKFDTTEPDKFDERSYEIAKQKICKYCKVVTVRCGNEFTGIESVEEPDFEDIIPVSINTTDRTSVNIFNTSEHTPWYNGLTLINAIKKKVFQLRSEYQNRYIDDKSDGKLLMCMDKEFPRPQSKAGKVWRVIIENGTLRVGDSIKITSVNRIIPVEQGKAPRRSSEVYNVTATVKSIHRELYTYDEVQTANFVLSGNIVTIDLKDCYIDGKKINKSDFAITKQSYAFATEEVSDIYCELSVRFSNPDKANNAITRIGQELMILWFGKGLPCKVTNISDDLRGMTVSIEHGKQLYVPRNSELRELLASVQFNVDRDGKTHYLSGYIKF